MPTIFIDVGFVFLGVLGMLGCLKCQNCECMKQEYPKIYVIERSQYYKQVLSQPTITLPPARSNPASVTTPLLPFTKL